MKKTKIRLEEMIENIYLLGIKCGKTHRDLDDYIDHLKDDLEQRKTTNCELFQRLADQEQRMEQMQANSPGSIMTHSPCEKPTEFPVWVYWRLDNGRLCSMRHDTQEEFNRFYSNRQSQSQPFSWVSGEDLGATL